jgi:hypothetical protein
MDNANPLFFPRVTDRFERSCGGDYGGDSDPLVLPMEAADVLANPHHRDFLRWRDTVGGDTPLE